MKFFLSGLFFIQILTFYGNFQNALPAHVSFSNIRPIKIMFYVEDGTMKIIEPKTNNSGLYQGITVYFAYKLIDIFIFHKCKCRYYNWSSKNTSAR